MHLSVNRLEKESKEADLPHTVIKQGPWGPSYHPDKPSGLVRNKDLVKP